MSNNNMFISNFITTCTAMFAKITEFVCSRLLVINQVFI